MQIAASYKISQRKLGLQNQKVYVNDKKIHTITMNELQKGNGSENNVHVIGTVYIS
jgi:hypothetical protein